MINLEKYISAWYNATCFMPKFFVETKIIDGQAYVNLKDAIILLRYTNEEKHEILWEKFCKDFKEAVKDDTQLVEDMLKLYNTKAKYENKYRRELPEFIPLKIVKEMSNGLDIIQKSVIDGLVTFYRGVKRNPFPSDFPPGAVIIINKLIPKE